MNAKRHLGWVFLMFIGLLSFSSMSLAEKGPWTRKADIPTPSRHFSTSAVNGKIYAIGGWDRTWSSAVEEYDPMTDTWTKKADMPTPRYQLSTSVVNGKIYAIGGFDKDETLSTVEEYDPVTDLGVEVETKGKLVTSWGKIKAKY